MAKDPAFLFYPGDWLGGTMTFSRSHKGAYMDLLMGQYNNGHMSIEDIQIILGSDFETMWESKLKLKFKVDADGKYFNEKLESEILKRKKFTESRKKNISTPNVSATHMDSHMDSHMENGDLNVNASEDVSKKEESPKTENLTLVFPFTSDQFTEAWQFWKSYKQKQHRFKYKSIESEQAALNRLTQLSGGIEETAIEIIKQSMGNGWQGLCEIKTTNNGAKSNSSQSIKDSYKDYAAELATTLQTRIIARVEEETNQPDRPG